jgi:hypothetical protein
MVAHVDCIALVASDGELTLYPSQQAWCQVVLTTPGASQPIGAEHLRYITDHLIKFLTVSALGQHWVLSLSERHVSAYGSYIGEVAELSFQGSDAIFFATLHLTLTQQREWARVLTTHS